MNNDIFTSSLLINNESIEDCIYIIRNKHVMLDSDIANFFGIETKNLNRQMKRNLSRFPEDFCFQLNLEETKNLRFQNGASKHGGRRYPPYVYTEHGVIALAGVLKSETADKMSVEIARKFIEMRKFILENSDILLSLAKLQNRQLEFENETNAKFGEMLNMIGKFDLPKTALISSGKWYDAFEFITSLIHQAKNSIILIDPYCDAKALTYLSHKQTIVEIIVVKGNKSTLKADEIEFFEKQYGPITIKTSNDIHDRYLIIDKDVCYSLGASLNYAGKKLFTMIKVEDKEIVDYLINKSTS